MRRARHSMNSIVILCIVATIRSNVIGTFCPQASLYIPAVHRIPICGTTPAMALHQYGRDLLMPKSMLRLRKTIRFQSVPKNIWYKPLCIIDINAFWIDSILPILLLTFNWREHCSDVMMGAMASQITSVYFVYTTVCSDADQIKLQSSASLASVRGILWGEFTGYRWIPRTKGK